MADSGLKHVFIDESGDAGFKLDKGSSRIFCIAAVVFERTEDIITTQTAIESLRARLGLKYTHEFHFNREPERIRARFCEAIATCPVTIRAIVVDKTRIYPESMLRRSPKHFYNYITKLLLKHSFGAIVNARARIDGRMNRELRTYLRQELNRETRVIHDIRFADSKTDSMIQLADMIAGSIARSYRPEKKNYGLLRWMIESRIQEVWDFGTRKS